MIKRKVDFISIFLICVFFSFSIFKIIQLPNVVKLNTLGFEGSKYLLLILDFTNISIFILYTVMANYVSSKKKSFSILIYWKILRTIIIFAGLFQIFILNIVGNSMNLSINEGIICVSGTGIILIILGNYLPTFKQNSISGIRTKWTLGNEKVWNRTHKMGGYISIIFGILMFVLGFFVVDTIIIFITIMVCLLLWASLLIIYSYWIHIKLK